MKEVFWELELCAKFKAVNSPAFQSFITPSIFFLSHFSAFFCDTPEWVVFQTKRQKETNKHNPKPRPPQTNLTKSNQNKRTQKNPKKQKTHHKNMPS